jgi:hypothetical protein
MPTHHTTCTIFACVPAWFLLPAPARAPSPDLPRTAAAGTDLFHPLLLPGTPCRSKPHEETAHLHDHRDEVRQAGSCGDC